MDIFSIHNSLVSVSYNSYLIDDNLPKISIKKSWKHPPFYFLEVHNRCFSLTSKVNVSFESVSMQSCISPKISLNYIWGITWHFYFLEIRISKLHCGMKSKVHVNIVHLRNVIIVQGLLTNFAARNWNIWFRSWMEWNKLLMIIKWK